MENLKNMEKNGNYFVREDMVSEQHVHHKDEYREKKRDKVVLTSTIFEETTPVSYTHLTLPTILRV